MSRNYKKAKVPRKSRTTCIAIFICFILSLCGLVWTQSKYLRGYIAPLTCGHQLLFSENNLFESWDTSYGSENSAITETIILDQDFTYTQIFEDGRTHTSTWQMIYDELDSPKIQLDNGKYYYNAEDDFGFVISLGNDDSAHTLYPQPVDMLLYEENGLVDHNKFIVEYPEDGFIYLYPRICNGELVLQGMADFFNGLDGVGSEGPKYHLSSP